MSGGPSCPSCGAVMASGQEHCLECGAKRPPAARTAWTAPLLAAAVTVLLAAAVFVLAYQRLRDDAENDAARGTPTPGLTPAPSAAPGASGAQPRPPAAPLAPAVPSP